MYSDRGTMHACVTGHLKWSSEHFFGRGDINSRVQSMALDALEEHGTGSSALRWKRTAFVASVNASSSLFRRMLRAMPMLQSIDPIYKPLFDNNLHQSFISTDSVCEGIAFCKYLISTS